MQRAEPHNKGGRRPWMRKPGVGPQELMRQISTGGEGADQRAAALSCSTMVAGALLVVEPLEQGPVFQSSRVVQRKH